MEWHFVQVMGSAREWYIQGREESVCPSFLPFEQMGSQSPLWHWLPTSNYICMLKCLAMLRVIYESFS